MDSPLVVALVISAIGITLLFLALAFFYGLLSLMTSAIQDRSSASPAQEEGGPDDNALLQAAAIAVAMARSQAERGSSPISRPTEDDATVPGHVSPWWALHHQRQLTPGSNTRRDQ